MKKIGVLLLAAGMVLGCSGAASAMDFKVKGLWQFAFDYASGGNFMKRTRSGGHVQGAQWNSFRVQRDNFWAGERVNLQLEAVASENLSGTVHLEIGDMAFGNGKVGGAMGADGTLVRVKDAYLDWTAPGTDLKVRMGIQPVALPGMAFSNMVFDTDAAGVSLSYAFNESVSLSALWLRPYNDNWTGEYAGYLDNFDLGALILPISGDGFRVTPWVMAGAYGPNIGRRSDTGGFLNPSNKHDYLPEAINAAGQPGDWLFFRAGTMPAAFSSSRDGSSLFSPTYTTTAWGGLSLEKDFASSWRAALDFVVGSVQSERSYLDRTGWYASGVVEYQTDWGKPGIYGWYYSGDDGNVHNGSERMPTITTANHYFNCISSFGFRGTAGIGGGKGVLGGAPDGLWGAGFRLQDMSLIDKLSHTFRVHYFGGTNSPDMAAYITGRRTTDDGGRPVYRNFTDFNSPVGVYMTTKDTGVEVNFDTRYKIYDNLTAVLELGYIHLWLDKDTWGGYGTYNGNSLSYKDAWKVNAVFLYMF